MRLSTCALRIISGNQVMKIVDLVLQDIFKSLSSLFALWISIIKDPVGVIKEKDISSDEELKNSLKFVMFIYILIYLITIPIDYSLLEIEIFDFESIIVGYISAILLVVISCLLTFLFARMLGGRGAIISNVNSMLLCTAFVPIFYLTQYISRQNTAWLELVYERNLNEQAMIDTIKLIMDNLVFFSFVYIIELFVIIILYIKIVPVIKYVNSLSYFRASVVFIFVGISFQFLSIFLFGPIWSSILFN